MQTTTSYQYDWHNIIHKELGTIFQNLSKKAKSMSASMSKKAKKRQPASLLHSLSASLWSLM